MPVQKEIVRFSQKNPCHKVHQVNIKLFIQLTFETFQKDGIIKTAIGAGVLNNVTVKDEQQGHRHLIHSNTEPLHKADKEGWFVSLDTLLAYGNLA